MNLQIKFQDNWIQKLCIDPTQKVLLAVSGGIDSMVLAVLLLQCKIKFGVAHCNFQLRGKDADGDQQFVADWCAKNNIPFHTTAFKTNEIAIEQKKGIQEIARSLRYNWFEEIRTEFEYAAILTAHHADDNAETMLINLSRGTGIAGLHGIPEKNGRIIRPLLFATRNEIVAYAENNSIQYRVDSSNSKDDYLRNAIRHHIIPILEEKMPGIAKRMLQTSNRIAEAEIIYNKAIAAERKLLLQRRGADIYVPVRLLISRKPLQTICYELFAPFNFSPAQTQEIVTLLQSETGKYISSSSHRIIKNRGFLIITGLPENETSGFLLVEQVPAKVIIGKTQYSFKTVEKLSVENDACTAFIDATALKFPLILRKYRMGDYFYPLGMGLKKKKISRFLIDQKLSLHEKENVWVIESDKRIIWVCGMRIDERFKVTSNTKSVIKISKKEIV